ncbi:MAG TPA: creatininase family protein, partial [Acidimicrobiia bacterium]
PEIAGAAADGAVAILPMGCTEQQGPHLTVGFDSWFAEELCLAASERAAEACGVASVVLPAMPFGPTPEHRGFGAGFIDLPRSVHEEVLEAAADSLASQGFTRLLVWRGCGGHDLAAISTRWNDRWRGRGRLWLPEQPFAAIWAAVGDASVPGGHADSFATSIALHRHPELVRVDLIPGPSAQPDWADPDLDFTEHSSTGVIGDARAASTELGAALWEECVTVVAEVIRDVADAPII